MDKSEYKQIKIFLALWTLLICSLIAHASGRVNIKLFSFPQAKGVLILVEEGYKAHNLVGLREEVYAIPQGVQFIHPGRKSDLKKNGIFVAHSAEEGRRMVDAGTENISDPLILRQSNVGGYNIFERSGRFFAVVAMDPETGTPMPVATPYRELPAGDSLDAAISRFMKNPERPN